LFYSVLSLKHGRKQLQAAAYGQGKPGLNLENIRTVVIELPPIAEQQEIVRRVDALFEIADEIDRLFAKARSRVEGLAPSILTKAFRGDLVVSEAKLAESEGRPFESAQELLARVQPDFENEAKLEFRRALVSSNREP
jgi:type I restriction enzyme, S subunit